MKTAQVAPHASPVLYSTALISIWQFRHALFDEMTAELKLPKVPGEKLLTALKACPYPPTHTVPRRVYPLYCTHTPHRYRIPQSIHARGPEPHVVQLPHYTSTQASPSPKAPDASCPYLDVSVAALASCTRAIAGPKPCFTLALAPTPRRALLSPSFPDRPA